MSDYQEENESSIDAPKSPLKSLRECRAHLREYFHKPPLPPRARVAEGYSQRPPMESQYQHSYGYSSPPPQHSAPPRGPEYMFGGYGPYNRFSEMHLGRRSDEADRSMGYRYPQSYPPFQGDLYVDPDAYDHSESHDNGEGRSILETEVMALRMELEDALSQRHAIESMLEKTRRRFNRILRELDTQLETQEVMVEDQIKDFVLVLKSVKRAFEALHEMVKVPDEQPLKQLMPKVDDRLKKYQTQLSDLQKTKIATR